AVSGGSSAAPSPARTLAPAAERIHEASQSRVVTIGGAEPAGGSYRIAAAASRDGRTLCGQFAMDTGIIGRGYREKKTQNVGDVATDPDYLALVATTGSEVAVPILWG